MLWNKSLAALSVVLLVVSIAMLVLAPGAWALSKYKTLYKFKSGTDGDSPWAGVIFDQAGNLYGTTLVGGDGIISYGTVFKLTPNADGSWKESILYNFCSLTNCADGAGPIAGLIFDQAGNLYGTTVIGGSGVFCSRKGGCGVVFKLTPNVDGSWTESVLYNFCSLTNCTDGFFPIGTLIFDQTGNLYSMAVEGGITGGSCGSSFGCGVVFELTPHADGSWTESVLHSFCSFTNCVDGWDPQSGLTFDANGNLYGTTGSGGKLTCMAPNGCGVVFKLTPNPDGSWTDSVLHRFAGKDGEFPAARVIFDQAGNLYSTTQVGGNLSTCPPGCGVVFQLMPHADGSWKEKVLHRFTDGRDGGVPHAGLIFDQAGNLYGVAASGGKLSCGCGVVFKLAPNSKGGWNETVLHDFGNHPGVQPLGDLIFDAVGSLYGTTLGNSMTTHGSVFEIRP
jgi:uncharacterized repeat protein (TIGR03803 family)